jgi:hypothetical protein
MNQQYAGKSAVIINRENAFSVKKEMSEGEPAILKSTI